MMAYLENDEMRDGSGRNAGAEASHGKTVDGSASSFITIKEVNMMSRGRTLRLQADDVIIAIDGEPFHGSIDELLDALDEADPDDGVLMALWRQGMIFQTIVRGPLGCIFEHTAPEVAEKVNKHWLQTTKAPLENYVMYEVLKDVHRNCQIIDTRPDPFGYILPPFWLIQKQLWEPLVALIMIYGVTFSVHWTIFVFTVIILAVYFSRAQTALLRSYALLRKSRCGSFWPLPLRRKSSFSAAY